MASNINALNAVTLKSTIRSNLPSPTVLESKLLSEVSSSTSSSLANQENLPSIQNLPSFSLPSNTTRSGYQTPKKGQHIRNRSFPRTLTLTQKLRVYHDDQPYLALPPPISRSGINSLLPCPPTSPSGRRTRLKIHVPIHPFKRSLSAFPVVNWLSSRLHGLSLPNSPTVWIGLYFTLNLTLTLYNKFVLIHFPFPYTLTALHALCGTIGTFIAFRLELTPDPPVPKLKGREIVVLLLFSLLYTVNIVVSNASLELVTVPFHQVVRGSAPLFTILLAALIFKKGCSRMKLLSLVPVMAGVGFATYGDYYYTLFGFALTLLGTVLAALKTVITNVLLRAPAPPAPLTSAPSATSSDPSQNKHKKTPSILTYIRDSNVTQRAITTSKSALHLPKLTLTPLQLLYLMSPLAFIQSTVLALVTGELNRVRNHMAVPSTSSHIAHGMHLGFGLGSPSWWLLLNGAMAFALNVVSFNSNKKIGPVGMSVAANVKQVLTILCAVVLFDLTITFTNGIGIALTLIGGAWYASVEVQEKQKNKRSG